MNSERIFLLFRKMFIQNNLYYTGIESLRDGPACLRGLSALSHETDAASQAEILKERRERICMD